MRDTPHNEISCKRHELSGMHAGLIINLDHVSCFAHLICNTEMVLHAASLFDKSSVIYDYICVYVYNVRVCCVNCMYGRGGSTVMSTCDSSIDFCDEQVVFHIH
jgi:hypothetical protein